MSGSYGAKFACALAALVLLVVLVAGCGGTPSAPAAPLSTPRSAAPVLPPHDESNLPLVAPTADARGTAAPTADARGTTIAVAPPTCSAADWSTHPLAPLLRAGKTPTSSQTEYPGATEHAFESECTDSPSGPTWDSPHSVVIDGVALELSNAAPAGVTRRGWPGNQCAFEVRAADGSGRATRLGPKEVPPFTTVSAVVRAGSAAWISLSFNGYAAEFPRGGNRVVAVDLCDGRVVWKTKDSTSNGGLLLLGDYLVSSYGFTNESRHVFVLDAHSGNVVQRLPVIENICPSRRWAPNWHEGDRCDAPGQSVGAATNPRVEGGLVLVDTNTGSSSFEFR